jgi:hypothetical protein
VIDYTQMRLRVKVEANGVWSSPADLIVEVPHTMLVSLMAEPFLADARQRAEAAEANLTRAQARLHELRSRGWWARLRNKR